MTITIKQKFAWELLQAYLNAVELVDLDGTILYINNAAVHRHGTLAGELTGTSFLSMYPSSGEAHRKTVMNKVTNSEPLIQFTDHWDDHWAEVVICPIEGPSGKVEEVVAHTCQTKIVG